MKAEAKGVRVTQTDGVVRVSGDLTIGNATAVLDAAGAFNGQGDRLVFDLSEVERCDSAALAVLLEWLRHAGRQGREVVFRHVPERLRQLARISDLESVLELDTSA